MPIRGSKDVRPRYIEMPADLDEQLAAFAAARGQTIKAVVVEACRRHLAYPPAVVAPPPMEPLPDGEGRPRGKAK
jgi:hypothetical protein